MKNFVQAGDMITATAPAGGILSGAGLLAGSLFGVAATSQAEGGAVEIATNGVFDLPKASADTFAFGAKAYWDATAKNCTSADEGNSLIGVAVEAAGNGATTLRVRLNGAAI
ncbi:DUF2190 family protein [Phreatobacter sp. HK31-P]